MSIYTGASETQEVKIGSQDASAVYVGSEQVWPVSKSMEAAGVFLQNSTGTMHSSGPDGFEATNATVQVLFPVGTNYTSAPLDFYYDFEIEFITPVSGSLNIQPWSYPDNSPEGFPLSQYGSIERTGGGQFIVIGPSAGQSYMYYGSSPYYDDDFRNGGRFNAMYRKTGAWNSSYGRLGFTVTTGTSRVRVSNWSVSANTPLSRRILDRLKDAKDKKYDS